MLQTYNQISSAVFDVVMAPFGHDFAAFDLILWPVIMGVVALQVYKYASNQAAITRVKRQISMRLLEIRLFSHDIAQVLKSTGTIVGKNSIYLGHNLLPMLVMLAPMVALMVQLVAHYAYAPSPTGAVELLRVQVDPAADVRIDQVALELPSGISLDAPVVRTADGQVFWRLRADEAGDHVLRVSVGDETFEKGWAVGGPPRKVPVKRLRTWEALLYPGEAAIPAGAPVISLELATPTRALDWFPEGEFGILMWALVLSLVAGFALKGVFGVTI
jgi:hypothetical protein